MKRILLVQFVLLALVTTVRAQFWLEAGLKGFVGTTVPLNGNVFSDETVTYKLTPDYAYGAKLAFNFGDNNGVVLDGLFSQYKAKYQYDAANNTAATYDLALKNIDIYPLYRRYYERSFFEIGPKISLLSSAKATHSLLPATVDVKENFNATNFGASFGFGGYLFGSEYFSVGMNVRIDYQFTDLVAEDGKTNGYLLPVKTYTNYKATHPITARIGLELTVPIGGVAKAQCGRRTFFMGGNR